ncbi:DNA topoisomerase 1-like [Gossypium hirsutum]|uniref:DNA topoisomerase 1-like n=1 Tax=Gossypium hirsutum TaxID=3635 RepID=A0ABM3AEW7_GOSHI|nr:DNA topoisomerase 1-like [Gossypium hirsutum]
MVTAPTKCTNKGKDKEIAGGTQESRNMKKAKSKDPSKQRRNGGDVNEMENKEEERKHENERGENLRENQRWKKKGVQDVENLKNKRKENDREDDVKRKRKKKKC